MTLFYLCALVLYPVLNWTPHYDLQLEKLVPRNDAVQLHIHLILNDFHLFTLSSVCISSSLLLLTLTSLDVFVHGGDSTLLGMPLARIN